MNALHYQIDCGDRAGHRYHVTLRIPKPTTTPLHLSLPVWVPGSYMVREMARHISGLQAVQKGVNLPLTALDKATWRLEAQAGSVLEVSYTVYAFDTSVRNAFLDAQRGFFNASSLCLQLEGFEDQPHDIELLGLPEDWRVATSMPPSRSAAHSYKSKNYDELIDHPFELGPFWQGAFKVAGVTHQFAVTGAWPDFDPDRLMADAQRICNAHIDFWHPADKSSPAQKPPFDRYVFLLNAVDDGYGGLEHRASTALMAARRDLPSRPAAGVGKKETPPSEGYTQLLGLISHEYFHAWNVKKLKPDTFAKLDLRRENYTELLWFFEGITSYFDDLMLLRCGLIDAAHYLKLINKTVNQVLAAPGRAVHSLAQASFDAWIKYYRSDENSPNATVSYYAKGALLGLALDLSLRAQAPPEPARAAPSLDAVMRHLWQAHPDGLITEDGIAQALQVISGRSYAPELSAWVHGTTELPLPELLAALGVDWQTQPGSVAQRLGVRVNESALTGVRITHVMHGSRAYQAGLSAGDELLGVGNWRVRRLDDIQRLTRLNDPQQPALWLVSRDQRLVSLPVPRPFTHRFSSACLKNRRQPLQIDARHGWAFDAPTLGAGGFNGRGVGAAPGHHPSHRLI
jgi:predicted metalloprotease with PDZ domain